MRTHAQPARVVTVLACIGITSWASAGEITFSTVALSGDVAPGTLALVARGDGQAPGTPEGVKFLDSFFWSRSPRFNDAGVWAGGPGSLALVALPGDHAPGTPAGVTFNTFTPLVLNGLGHTLIKALLTGPGVTTANRDGIWVQTPGGPRPAGKLPCGRRVLRRL